MEPAIPQIQIDDWATIIGRLEPRLREIVARAQDGGGGWRGVGATGQESGYAQFSSVNGSLIRS